MLGGGLPARKPPICKLTHILYEGYLCCEVKKISQPMDKKYDQQVKKA
jgi:hypothetical protein